MPPDNRRALLAKVHIARKALAIEEDSYRALLMRVAGGESAGDFTDAQLVRVIDEFRRLGWKGDRKLSDKPQVRLIYGLWKELKPFLQYHSPAALAAFVERQTGIAKPEWLSPEDANKVVEGLKAWLARVKAKEAAGV